MLYWVSVLWFRTWDNSCHVTPKYESCCCCTVSIPATSKMGICVLWRLIQYGDNGVSWYCNLALRLRCILSSVFSIRKFSTYTWKHTDKYFLHALCAVKQLTISQNLLYTTQALGDIFTSSLITAQMYCTANQLEVNCCLYLIRPMLKSLESVVFLAF